MKTLADNVELDGSFTPEDVRDMLVEAVNLAWSQNGNNARCTVTANFIAWILLENDRLRARVDELENSIEVFRRAADESEQRSLVKELREDVAEDGKTIEAFRVRMAKLEEFIRDITKYLPRLANERARYVLSNAGRAQG